MKLLICIVGILFWQFQSGYGQTCTIIDPDSNSGTLTTVDITTGSYLCNETSAAPVGGNLIIVPAGVNLVIPNGGGVPTPIHTGNIEIFGRLTNNNNNPPRLDGSITVRSTGTLVLDKELRLGTSSGCGYTLTVDAGGTLDLTGGGVSDRLTICGNPIAQSGGSCSTYPTGSPPYCEPASWPSGGFSFNQSGNSGINYTWDGSASSVWSTATNWTPDRTTTSDQDRLTFNATGANRSITDVPTQTVGSVLVTGSTSYSFAPTAGGNNLTLNSTTGNSLQIDNGSTLTVGTVSNALNITAPTGGQVEIGGQLNLVNGNLGAGGAIVTLHTNSTPLARTSGQVSINGSSSLRFGNSSNISGSTIVLPNSILVASPTTVGTIIVNRTNGATLGNQAIQIQTSATFTLGDLNTNAAGLLIFTTTSSAPTESSSSKIVGSAEMDFRTVGTSGLSFLGFNANAGTDDVGSIRIQRRTGSTGINVFNANESIASTWIISRVGGVEPAAGRNIQFSWLSDFDNSRPVTNQFQVYRFNSGPGWTAVGALQNLAATTPQRQTAAVSVTDITDTFTVTDESQILPVELLFFSAATEKNSVLTSWATATERNTDYFLVERSTDGESFLPLGQVNAVGNSRQRNNYQLEDPSPWIGRAYYRLTSVDFDGFRESFPLQAVDFSGERSARLFPNPVENHELNVQLSFTPERFYGVVITDTKGVELLRTQTAEPRITLPLDVPPGVYIVRVVGDAVQQVSKIVVR